MTSLHLKYNLNSLPRHSLHYWAPSNVSHLIFKSRSDSHPPTPLYAASRALFAVSQIHRGYYSSSCFLHWLLSLLGILFSWILTWLAPPQPSNLCSNAASLESHPMKMAPRGLSLTPILLPFPQSMYYYLNSYLLI